MPSLVEIGTVALEKKILNLINVFSMLLTSPIRKESLSFKDALYQVGLKLDWWFLKKKMKM